MGLKQYGILVALGLCMSINGLSFAEEAGEAEIAKIQSQQELKVKQKAEKSALIAKHKAETAELKAKQKAELEELVNKQKAEATTSKEGGAPSNIASSDTPSVEGQATSEANTPTNANVATDNNLSTTSIQTITPVQPPASELPYVLVDDNMSNLQLDNANKPVFDKYTLAERRNLGLNTYMPELTPYRNGKIAYLTFDDGPEGTNTPAILDILKAEGVKATFYVVGNQCYGAPSVLKRMFDEGHAIGNHTYSHDYDNLYPYVDNFLEELGKTERIVKEIIGVRPLIVRAPGGTYGMFTSAYYPALKAAGYVEHDWNVCIDDAVGGHPLAWEFVQKVREQTASGISSAIVLMHSSYGKGETVRALPEIIQLLRERGYSFGVMTPMTPQPW